MTTSPDLLPLRLQLSPMSVAATMPQPIVRTASQTVTPEIAPFAWQQSHLCQQVLHPGEPSEIVVQLENTCDRTLRISLETEGTFPLDWCRIGQEGQTLPPGSKMEAVLYFQLPEDFFEAESSPAFIQTQGLDFRGRLCVYFDTVDAETNEATSGLTLETAEFLLFVRPRSLYPTFLPDIYKEVDFIGRFLHIFEQAFEPAVQTLDTLWAYLDPLTAPETLLPFLAHWVGWQLASELPLSRQRSLIRQAIQLYQWRGTRKGLRLYLHLYTGLPLEEFVPEDQKQISIQDSFNRGLVLGETHLGEESTVGGGKPFHFSVCLRPQQPLSEPLIHKIIQQEKPAFCTYDLSIESS